jgi:hypothetical protein
MLDLQRNSAKAEVYLKEKHDKELQMAMVNGKPTIFEKTM